MHKLNRRTYLLGGLFVLALTALFAFANWHWLRANVVTYGWDRLDHLITSFVYRDTLSQVTPRSLLAALAYSDYYPPLVHYGAVVLYSLFGVDEDVAPMINVFYMAILLGATFWIAARWRVQQLAGTAASAAGAAVFWTGALAAALLGLFPIIFAMSRYLYLDFALTALVALDMALLIGSERFARRWPALGVGLVLGLAFWVKWTAAAFVIGPLIYMVLRAGVLPYAWRHPRALLPRWRWLVLALAAGVAVIGLWFWLAQDVVAALPLGWSLVPLLGLLLGGVFYTVFVPSRSAGVADARRIACFPAEKSRRGRLRSGAAAQRAGGGRGCGVCDCAVVPDEHRVLELLPVHGVWARGRAVLCVWQVPG